MTIIYCYDAYCGWCYGFSPVIRKIAEEFQKEFRFEVLSGGMILPDYPQPISVVADFMKDNCKKVEELAGATFGPDFMFHINRPEDSDWFPNSEKPAIALCVLKEYMPDEAVRIAADLQHALYAEGRDLTDDEAYRHLLLEYNIDPDEFYTRLHSETYKEKAYYEFQLVKQLQVESYPQVLLQISDSKFYLLAKGYTDYETFRNTISSVLIQIQSAQN